MNKTVLGILGFLLLAPGLVLLGMGGIIVGPLLCAVGGALLVLAIKPEWFKRYFIVVMALLLIGGAVLGFGVWFLMGHASEPEIHTLS
jgi:hypothetical protein